MEAPVLADEVPRPRRKDPPLVIRRLLPSLLIAGLLLTVPASASARTNVAVGVGDQSSTMFADANWKALSLKKTRFFLEWNTIDQPGELAKTDAFVAAARNAGVSVLLHISTDDINSDPVKPLPSVAEYKDKVGQLVARYRAQGVKDWGVWNEANHKSQPTASKPKRAAEFYKTFRKLTCSSCKIVALDVLDQSGVEKYIASWMKAAGSAGKKARVFGIHNYSEVNRKLSDKKRSKKNSFKKYPGTKRIMDAVRKKNAAAKFWYTETGGAKKVSTLGCNATRQASATKFMFGIAKKYDRYVERLYTYNWFGSGCDRFDAGLVEADGTPRAAYGVLKSNLRNFRR
jgi:hypothetical protein